MMQLHCKGEEDYVKTGFPKNEPAVVLAYRVVNGRTEVAHKELNGSLDVRLQYKPTSFAELRALVESLQATQEEGSETADATLN